MKPKKLRVPAMFYHKAPDQDAVCIRDERGKRRTTYLGKCGSDQRCANVTVPLSEYASMRGPPRPRTNGARVCTPDRTSTSAE